MVHLSIDAFITRNDTVSVSLWLHYGVKFIEASLDNFRPIDNRSEHLKWSRKKTTGCRRITDFMNLLLKKVWRIVFFTDMTNNHCYTWRHKFQHFIVINSDVTACDIIFYPPYRKSFSKFIALSIRSEICSDSLSDPCKIAFLWDSKDSVKVKINYFNMKLNLSKITFPKHKQSVSLIQSVITQQLTVGLINPFIPLYLIIISYPLYHVCTQYMYFCYYI